ANTVREQLEPLIDLGLVERRLARPTGPGRPGFRYAARRESRPGRGEQPYRALAAVLADRLAGGPDPHSEAVAAGERWGRSLVATTPPATDASGAVAVLVTLLDQAGFAPELGARPGEAPRVPASLGTVGPASLGPLGLRRCPFGAIVGGRREVVCGVHLGLMRGALEGIGAPLRATRLEPFVRPDLCLAYLAGPADG
ncbi:MAG: ArsR family transcriptional regulator, partial [Candidatus Limnocylindrales bacterium]